MSDPRNNTKVRRYQLKKNEFWAVIHKIIPPVLLTNRKDAIWYKDHWDGEKIIKVKLVEVKPPRRRL